MELNYKQASLTERLTTLEKISRFLEEHGPHFEFDQYHLTILCLKKEAVGLQVNTLYVIN